MILPYRGFTLLEFSVALVIFSIALFAVVPNFSSVKRSVESDYVVNELVGAINYARTQAILRGFSISLCPAGSSNKECGKDWNNGLLVFVDELGKGLLVKEEQVLRVYGAFPKDGKMSWNRNGYLTLDPTGMVHGGSNGTFRYCPKEGMVPFGREVVVSLTGRVRLGKGSS